MSMECYSHPGAAATATCIACEKPICAECREEVAGHTMCHSCVAATQERLSADAAPAAPETSAATATGIDAAAPSMAASAPAPEIGEPPLAASTPSAPETDGQP